MAADFPYERSVDLAHQEEHAARAKARPSLEQAIARAQHAVESPGGVDLVEARKAEVDEELRAHEQKRLSPWEWDGEVLACTAVRLDDQVKERVYARVPGLADPSPRVRGSLPNPPARRAQANANRDDRADREGTPC